MADQTIRIAMLNTDVPVPNVLARFGSYGIIFHRLLAEAAARISEIEIISAEFDVIQGRYPESIENFDAILITGSSASVYDNADWIRRLDAYVLDVYQNHPHVKIFGSCFGHQLVGQSLLRPHGVVVEKDPEGWEVGVREIQLSEAFKQALRSFTTPARAVKQGGTPSPEPENENVPVALESLTSMRMQFVHADHVKIPETVLLPDTWMVLGSTEHCAVQGLYEPGRVFTYQGHFEFDRFINTETLKVFGRLWEPQRLDAALEAIDGDDDAKIGAEIVVRFLASRAEALDSCSIRAGLITPAEEV